MLTSGVYNLLLTATDEVGNLGFEQVQVHVEGKPPQISSVDIAPLQGNETSLSILADIIEGSGESGVEKTTVSFAIYDRKGHLIAPHLPGELVINAPGSRGGSSACTWRATLPVMEPLHGTFTVIVTAKDNVGNEAASAATSFVIDTIGPHGEVVLEAGAPIAPGMILKGVASDIDHIWDSWTMHLRWGHFTKYGVHKFVQVESE